LANPKAFPSHDDARDPLQGMADALKAQEQDSGARELSFVERLSLLVDQQWNWARTRRWRGD
jgi:hypothetical protein